MLTILLLSVVVSLFLEPCLSRTVLVDGVSEWKDPIVHVGDTIVFRHKYGYDLYIFRSKHAFSLCNLTSATLLTKPNSKNFTWYPSRPGFYYFAFNNASLIKPTSTCPPSLQKLPIQVLISPGAGPTPSPGPMPSPAPAPAPKFGAGSSSPSSYPWPEGPREGSSSAEGPAPSKSTTVTVPDKGAPFIDSSPAVPLPTGEVDSVTIDPLPTASGSPHKAAVVGLLRSGAGFALFSTALLL